MEDPRKKGQSKPRPQIHSSFVSSKPAQAGAKQTEAEQTNSARTKGLLILHIDVDQGECTVFLRLENTRVTWCCVIDGGYSVKGRGALARYLSAFEVETVNALICSHFDGDHTQGLTSFLKHHTDVGIDALYVRDGTINGSDNTKYELLTAARDRKVRICVVKDQDVFEDTSLKVECIHACDGYLQDENEGSLGFVFQYGGFRYYTAGDLPSEQEERLLGRIGKIHAFKCGHHGSANSTPTKLLESAEPMLAFVSCGHQSFGHPTYDVIERLADCDSLQGLYVTNCVGNRRVLNSKKYQEDEERIAGMMIKRLDVLGTGIASEDIEGDSWKGIASGGQYDMKAIDRLLSKYGQHSNADSMTDVRRMIRRILRAAKRACEHQNMTPENHTIRAFVAGSAEMLGTIALYVPGDHEDGGAPEPVLYVGCSHRLSDDELSSSKEVEGDAGKTSWFRWHDYKRSERTEGYVKAGIPVLKDIGDRVVRAISEIQVNGEWLERAVVRPAKRRNRSAPRNVRNTKAEQPAPSSGNPGSSTPVAKKFVQGKPTNLLRSPKRFLPSVELRRTRYRRFDEPTIIGLRTCKTGKFVPFCFKCKDDRYLPDGAPEPVYEMVCNDQKCSCGLQFFHLECLTNMLRSDVSSRANTVRVTFRKEEAGKDTVFMRRCPECLNRTEDGDDEEDDSFVDGNEEDSDEDDDGEEEEDDDNGDEDDGDDEDNGDDEEDDDGDEEYVDNEEGSSSEEESTSDDESTSEQDEGSE